MIRVVPASHVNSLCEKTNTQSLTPTARAMIIHSFSHRKWNIIYLAGNAIVLLALFWLSAVPSLAGPVPPSDEEVSNPDAGAPFPLVELPAHALHRLSTHLSSEDTRSLVSTSRTVQEAIASLNADKLKFRGTNDLASVQLCLETCNFPCLEFWTPLLSETFRQEQLLSIRVLGEIIDRKCGDLHHSPFLARVDSLLTVEIRFALCLISAQLIINSVINLAMPYFTGMDYENLMMDEGLLASLKRGYLSAMSKYAAVLTDMTKYAMTIIRMLPKSKDELERELEDLATENSEIIHKVNAGLQVVEESRYMQVVLTISQDILYFWNPFLSEHQNSYNDFIEKLLAMLKRRTFADVYDSEAIRSAMLFELDNPFSVALNFFGYVHVGSAQRLWDFLIQKRRINELRYFMSDLGIFRRAKTSGLYRRVWTMLLLRQPYRCEETDLKLVMLLHENMEKYPELLHDAKAYGNPAILSYLQSKSRSL